MRIMRIFLLAVVVLVVNITITEAQFVSFERAKFVAENWMKRIGEQKNVTEGVSLQNNNGERIGYLFNFSRGGFVVVPTDDIFHPVKAWSRKGQFHGNPEFAMDMATMTIKGLQGQVQFLIHVRTEQDQQLQTNGSWNILSGKGVLNESDSDFQTMAGPMLKTEWEQYAPYNKYCPIGTEGNSTLTGCVTTAAGQIFRYWKWPKMGTGVKCYTDAYMNYGCGTGQYICADFSHEYYWDLMVDSYPYPNGRSLEENDAVAVLMADVGAMVSTCYSSFGSYGFSAGLVTGLPLYFGYSEEIRDVLRLRGEFFPVVREQIDKGWPVFSSSSGHAYVIDGYLIDGEMKQVHLNVGWGANYNGWYTIDPLNDFWNSQEDDSKYIFMIINIHPVVSPPAPPSLSVSIDGQTVSLKWSTFDADGYVLYYSSYPFLDVEDSGVHSITFNKEQISLSVTLPYGAVYYVATQGYNRYGYGELSEIKIIQIL